MVVHKNPFNNLGKKLKKVEDQIRRIRQDFEAHERKLLARKLLARAQNALKRGKKVKISSSSVKMAKPS